MQYLLDKATGLQHESRNTIQGLSLVIVFNADPATQNEFETDIFKLNSKQSKWLTRDT